MNLSTEYEGCVVTIQVARPLYVIDYAAHVTFPTEPQLRLIGEPIMRGEAPVAMDIFIGVRVLVSHPDRMVVSMLTPGGHRSRITIPSALILSITEIVDFEPADMPIVTTRKRAPGPSKPLVQL